jgi:serine/threonine-protein kinase
MSLVAGSHIGPFQVVAPIGAGGMGEVYRAHDTRLGRDVALKIRPAAFASDPERLARFEREARTLAALNHPHIAQIHGVEESPAGPGEPPRRALVMELVEGEDLAHRLARGPIPLAEAIAIAQQIAEALDAAHEVGVIHRDLKPANVRIRPDGAVKLLDFGLAKARDASTGVPSEILENSPTITSPAITERGVILGTAAYMAPEQAKGTLVDKRADVWAFGVVLYEMLSGRRPFTGSNSTEVIAQILEREPDWRALPTETPAHLQRLLRRCLQKDRRRRMRDCGDVMIELGEATLETPAAVSVGWWRRPGVAAAMGVVTGALAVILAGGPRAPEQVETPPQTSRFAVVAPGERLDGSGRVPMSVSRDGRRVVYSGSQQLMVRSFDELTPRAIPGTESMPAPAGERGNTGFAVQPILSPDGQTVAYSQGPQLKRVAVSGGVPTVICTCGTQYGATWSNDNSILFGRGAGPGNRGGVWRVSADGGTPEELIATEPGRIVLWPQLLPDGDHVLFTLTRGEHWDQADVVVQSLASGQRRVLVAGGIDGRYTSSGHLVYGKDGVLHAVKLDPASLQVSGSATPVLAGVAQQTSAGSWGGFAYTVSDEGTLVYIPAEAAAIRRVLVWVDRTGREEPLPTEPRAFQYPRFSPDGARVALDLRDQQNDVWSWDLVRSTLTRVTIGRRAGGPAIWNRDGGSVIFGPDVDGMINLHLQPVTGGPPRRLAASPNTQFADDLTPDGQWLVLAERDPRTGFDLRRLRMDGPAEPGDLLKTPFNELNADVSPDGRWIAYQSDESGRYEVYVRPFPQVDDGRWQVSSTGGTRPLWSRDGRELFFLDPGRRMTSVTVHRASPIAFGAPHALFETAHLGLEGQERNFDLAPDGTRFLLVRNLPPPDDVPTVVLVQNWFAELRSRVR